MTANQGAAPGTGRQRQSTGRRGTGRGPATQEDTRSNHGPSAGLNIEGISIATYICDFGNVVVGNPQKKSFRLTNCGRLPVVFNFKKEALQKANISIDSTDKNNKILPNCSALFNVTLTTHARNTKNKFGRMREIVPIEIKGGPQYDIEFRANLTQPELSMSSENLDFGKVCVQTRKTIKVRFENNKEVPCNWKYLPKADLSASAADIERF